MIIANYACSSSRLPPVRLQKPSHFIAVSRTLRATVLCSATGDMKDALGKVFFVSIAVRKISQASFAS